MERKKTLTHNAYYQRVFYERRPEKKQQYRLNQAIRLVTEAGYILIPKTTAPETVRVAN